MSEPQRSWLGLITLPLVWRECSLVVKLPHSGGLASLISAGRLNIILWLCASTHPTLGLIASLISAGRLIITERQLLEEIVV